jgi:RsiW-degrading membrane proteinase PrsW (M82 family)
LNIDKWVNLWYNYYSKKEKRTKKMFDIAMLCLGIFCVLGIVACGVFAFVADGVERKRAQKAGKASAYRW